MLSVHNDFVQFPITYYFHVSDRASALEVALPQLLALARNASEHDNPSVRLSGMLLFEALRDLTIYLAQTRLDCDDGADMDEVLAAYATAHLHRLDHIDSLSE